MAARTETTWATVGAVHVHYDDQGSARAALVVCEEPTLSTTLDEHVAAIARTEPGALYKRQLPCIRAVVALAPTL